MSMLENIVIYNPNENFGGAEVAFLNFIEILSKESNYTFQVVIHPKSRFEETLLKLNNPNTEIIYKQDYEYKENNDSLFLFNGQTLRWFEDTFQLRPKNIRIWLMHPDELGAYCVKGFYKIKIHFGEKIASIYFSFFSLFHKNQIGFISKIIHDDHLAYMDGSVRHNSMLILQKLDIFTEKNYKYLPVYSQNKSTFKVRENAPQQVKNIYYFGRVEDFKTLALCGLIDDIAAFDKNLNLHIIGSGSDMDHINAYASKLGVSLHIHGFLHRDVASALIHKEADLCFAMGIAALDCSVAQVPVVVLNPSYSKPPKERYNFLYEETEFGVGDFLTQSMRPSKKEKLKDFNEILNIVNADWVSQASQSYKHSDQVNNQDNFLDGIQTLLWK